MNFVFIIDNKLSMEQVTISKLKLLESAKIGVEQILRFR